MSAAQDPNPPSPHRRSPPRWRRREEGEMRSSLRLHPSSPAVPPLEDDDLLSEILLRLPPEPSSLPRASAVCRRWRLLLSDRAFSRRFRRHHRRNPPLLGFFHKSLRDLSLEPTLGAPNRVSPGRLSLQRHRDCDESFITHGCRHGLLLVSHYKNGYRGDPVRLVWDPVTGEQHRLGSPSGFDSVSSGAVLRAADHFQVVLVGTDAKQQAIASVYSSATGVWSNPVSTPFPLIPNDRPYRRTSLGGLSHIPAVLVGSRTSLGGLSHIPAVLVGSSLYWFLSDGAVGILEFDLDRHNLATIGLPAHLQAGCGSDYLYSIMPADDGGLGFLYLSGLSAQLWKRKTDHNGAASWMLGRTIELDKLLQLPLNPEEGVPFIMVIGFAEGSNTVFLRTVIGIFMIHLESLQFKKLSERSDIYCCYPFESVYGAGI